MLTRTRLSLRFYSLFWNYYSPKNHPYLKHSFALTFNWNKIYFIISIYNINLNIITIPYPYHVTGVVDGENQINLQDRNHPLFLLGL